jgi:hypothetical protein
MATPSPRKHGKKFLEIALTESVLDAQTKYFGRAPRKCGAETRHFLPIFEGLH